MTFLNNKKIDAELYAFFQSISKPEDGMTVVLKSSLPTQQSICKKLGIGDARTYKSRLKCLLETGYMVEEDYRYILPNKEDIYLLIPLSTLQFMQDVLKEPVIKTYIYLAQKWKQKQGYEFSYEEIASHIGIKLAGNARGYQQIANILTVLQNNGLIRISDAYWVGNLCRRKLLEWNSTYVKH